MQNENSSKRPTGTPTPDEVRALAEVMRASGIRSLKSPGICLELGPPVYSDTERPRTVDAAQRALEEERLQYAHVEGFPDDESA